MEGPDTVTVYPAGCKGALLKMPKPCLSLLILCSPMSCCVLPVVARSAKISPMTLLNL